MHEYHADRFDGLESGAYSARYGHQIPSTPSPTPTTVLHRRPVGSGKSAPVTPTDQVREAVKDGNISDKEKTAFQRTPVTREIVKDEQARLTKAVRGADDNLARGNEGRPVVRDGKVQPSIDGVRNETEHEARVRVLAETRDRRSLEQLDAEITTLEESKAPVGLEALRTQRQERVTAEREVAAVVDQKESLVGTLEAEKLELAAGESADAAGDFQRLREDAQPWIEQFNANGGQFYEGNDLFGDDWDATEVDFDRLAARFSDDPEKLAQFAEVQGEKDGDLRGRSKAEIETYLEGRDPSEARAIALRYQAATELQGVFERHAAAKDGAVDQGERLEAIDSEIGYLTASIDHDRGALSQQTLDAIDAANEQTAGIIEAPEGGSTGGTSTDGGAEGSADGSTGGGTGGSTDGSAGGGTGGSTGGEDRATDASTDGGIPATGTERAAGGTPIDYGTPEGRAQVLAAAQERSLLPSANTSFDERGQAVYTVQAGDSYWRIADMSDGRPPNEFDPAHFVGLVDTNSQRLGRDPRVGLIHPNEQLVLTGRSLDELVALLELPSGREPQDGPPAHPGVPQGR